MWPSEPLPFPLFLCLLAICCCLSHYLLTSYLLHNARQSPYYSSSPLPKYKLSSSSSSPSFGTSSTAATVFSNVDDDAPTELPPSPLPRSSDLPPFFLIFPPILPVSSSTSFSYLSHWPFSFFDLLFHQPITFTGSTSSTTSTGGERSLVRPASSSGATSSLPIFADHGSFSYLHSPPASTPPPVFLYQTPLALVTGLLNMVPSFWLPSSSTAVDKLSSSVPTKAQLTSVYNNSGGSPSGVSCKRRRIHSIPPSSLLPTFDLSFLEDFRYEPIYPLSTAPLLPPPTADDTTQTGPLPSAVDQPIHPHHRIDPTTNDTVIPIMSVPSASSFPSSPAITNTSHIAAPSAAVSPNVLLRPPAPSSSLPSPSLDNRAPSRRSFLFFNKNSDTTYSRNKKKPAQPPPPSPPSEDQCASSLGAPPKAAGSSVGGDNNDSNAMVIGDANLKECLHFCASLRGSQPVGPSMWELLHASPTCSVWKRQGTSSTAAFEYLARGRFDDISVEAYNVTVSDLTFRQQWDKHIVDIHLLDAYSARGGGTKQRHEQWQPSTGAKRVDERKVATTTKEPKKRGWRTWLGNASSSNSGSSYSSTADDNNNILAPSFNSTDSSNDGTSTTTTQGPHWFPPINTEAANSPSYRTMSGKIAIEEIIYWRFRIPFPFIQDRDFVYARRFANFTEDHNSDGGDDNTKLSGLVSVQQATTHERGPEKKGECVRIREYRNGLGLFALPGQSIYDKGMDYVLYFYDDPRSKLPGRIKGYLAATTLPVSMAELHKAAKKLHQQGTLPSAGGG
eukprot:GHVS01107751.1.p1 GENE.GHVS01107751.1~~GHVS01107751.1.p1  ORF type:complete len:787 (+),score=177.31 GHVS01107751.1:234-2594(+)